MSLNCTHAKSWIEMPGCESIYTTRPVFGCVN